MNIESEAENRVHTKQISFNEMLPLSCGGLVRAINGIRQKKITNFTFIAIKNNVTFLLCVSISPSPPPPI